MSHALGCSMTSELYMLILGRRHLKETMFSTTIRRSLQLVRSADEDDGDFAAHGSIEHQESGVANKFKILDFKRLVYSLFRIPGTLTYTFRVALPRTGKAGALDATMRRRKIADKL